MKKTTFTLLFSLSCHWMAAQCPTDITLSTQGQIDSFQINYPGCTDILGGVLIWGDDISNLDSLIGITAIEGNLKIGNPSGFFGTNTSNFFLKNLAGLDSLRTIGGGLVIKNNHVLANLNGLENLSEIGNDIVISKNDSLTSLSALSGLDTISGSLYIGAVYGSVSARIGNVSLKSLEGLGNIQVIEGSLCIFGDSPLENLIGLANLDSIGGSFEVDNHSVTSFNGLEKLKSIGELLSIHSLIANGTLTSMKGLDNLLSIGIGCSIYNQDALTNMNGLNKLSFCPALTINHNDALISLDGLDSITTFNYIEIGENPNLSICNIPPICALLQNTGFGFISNNAPGCNSVAEVKAACIVSIDETSTGEPAVIFSPNPAGDFLQIQVSDHEKWEISLFDLQGKQMFRQSVSGNQTIGVADWPSGLYALRAVSGERRCTGRFVKR